MEAAVFFAC